VNKVTRLKEALLDTLIDAVENGITIKDEETGEIHKNPAPHQLLSVASKVVKDFHDEVGKEEKKAGILSDTLKRYADRYPETTVAN